MRVHSVKMSNFKSIGETDNTIIIEPRVTAIVGKNESGKSNILEGLSYLNLTAKRGTGFGGDNVNRISRTRSIVEYEVILNPSPEEKKSLGISGETLIYITANDYIVSGSIVEVFEESLRDDCKALVDIIKTFPGKTKNPNAEKYKEHLKSLSIDDSVDIAKINAALTFFKTEKNKLGPELKEPKSNMSQLIESIEGIRNGIISALPNVFYSQSEKQLKTHYKLDEVQNELKKSSNDSLLSDLVKLIEIDPNDFIEAVKEGNTGVKHDLRKRINASIKKKINNKFGDFYKTEKISLEANFQSNNLSFTISTPEGRVLNFNERSNGLRWYLNMFIHAKAHGVTNTNTLYLFDEPGIYLHVNAQIELIKLFEDLAGKGNQVVYTTHSPFMLETDDGGIHRIRAVEKDQDEYSLIRNCVYDPRLSPSNKADTITPVIKAIGMSLDHTFGPAYNKLNVVTEGVSDYIYLKTMAKVLDIDMSKINIVPSVNAANCISICNILDGWNCPFIAILDYDKEGVESFGEKMRKKSLYELGRDYIYLRDVDQKEVDAKSYKTEKLDIEDLFGLDHIDDFKRVESDEDKMGREGKTLLAKMIVNSIEDKSYEVKDDTKERFRDLFERILINYESMNQS